MTDNEDINISDERMDRGEPTVDGKVKLKPLILTAIILVGAGMVYFLTAIEKGETREAKEKERKHYTTGVHKIPSSAAFSKVKSAVNEKVSEVYKSGISLPGRETKEGQREPIEGESELVSINSGKNRKAEETEEVRPEPVKTMVNQRKNINHSGNYKNQLTEEEEKKKWARRQVSPVAFEIRGGKNVETRTMESNPYGIEGLNMPIPDINEARSQLMSAIDGSGSGKGKGRTDPNTEFKNEVAANQAEMALAAPLGDLRYKILQGKIIHAVLITAIDSSLPGMVTAQVSRDIYGESGDEVLIPKGSEIKGRYNNATVQGQYRVYIVWSRIIRPDGIDVYINSAGTDKLGRTGSAGEVDSKFWTRFGNATLLSVLGAGTANYGSSGSDQINVSERYKEALLHSFADQASTELNKAMEVKDTIHLDQGEVITILVERDLDFSIAMKLEKQG